MVFSRFVDDAHLMVRTCVGIRDEPIARAAVQRHLMARVLETDNEVRAGHVLLAAPPEMGVTLADATGARDAAGAG